ncbi:MAG: hypothetical protein EPN64_11070 [Burkholderiaceae bacterium]|nr:MAG: hypothetical protein EPN64_11070 [Burkholderiaceae bacterium]
MQSQVSMDGINGKHTKGPLEYQILGKSGSEALIVEEDGSTVAYVSALENSTAHSCLEANVRLFAMAGNLLDELVALERSVRESNLCDDADLLFRANKARAAIARAIGAKN